MTDPTPPSSGPAPTSVFLRRLIEMKAELFRNACVVRCDRRYYRLRYKVRLEPGGKRFDRTIRIPDDAVDAVRHLLHVWRDERRRKREEDARRLREERLEARTQKMEERTIIAGAGGGWRRRKRNRQIFADAAAAGPTAEYLLSLSQDYLRPNRRRGPTRRAGLTLPRTPQNEFGREYKIGPFTWVLPTRKPLPPSGGGGTPR